MSALTTARAPRRYDRPGRIRLLGEAAKALLEGRLPDLEARMFLGSALLGWLESGDTLERGALERDYLKVTAPAGSHHTPAKVWQAAPSQGATGGADSATLEPSSPSEQEQ